MKYHLTLASLLLFIVAIDAQNCNYTFSGIIEDFHNKEPLEEATIYIPAQNKFAVADTQGRFRIDNLCRGEITAEVSHLGCKPRLLKFNLTQNIYKIINLEHHEEELKEVLVKGIRSTKTAASQVTTIKKMDIEKYSNLSLGDALKEVSGVESLNTGNSIVKPIINGLHSSRVLVNVNGVRLQDQEWGVEHAPNVDINSASNISVIKGANALEYGGDAIGGVVVINPSKIMTKDSLWGQTNITQQSNGLGGLISSKLYKTYKTGWFVNGNFSIKRFGDAKTPTYTLSNTGVKSQAANLQAGYKKFTHGFELYYTYLNSEIGILKASHIGNVADLVRAINTEEPLYISDFSFDINNPKQSVSHQIAKGKFYKRFKALGKFDLQYDYQRNHRLEYDIRRNSDDNKLPAVDLLLQTHTLTSNFKFDANSNRIFKLGATASYQKNYPDPSTKVRRLIPDYKKYDVGAYFIANFLFDKYVISTAIRYDFTHYDAMKYYYESRWNKLGYNSDFNQFIIGKNSNQYLTNPVFNYNNISASAGIDYDLSDNSSLLLNYALSNRTPNPSELFSDGLHHSAARIELGSLRIRTELSNRLGLSYHLSNNRLSITTEGFINKINRFIYIEPTGVEYTIRGAFPVYSYTQTDALMLGIDATLQYKIDRHWIIENKSAYIYGEDTKRNRPLIDIPPLKISNSLTYTHKGWHHFTAQLISVFVAKQNRFPNNNFKTYISTSNTYAMLDVSSTPSAYHLLNFNGSMQFNIRKTKLELGVMVQNILNTSYKDYLNRLRYFAHDLGRNFSVKLIIHY